jgi:hypothetical protein
MLDLILQTKVLRRMITCGVGRELPNKFMVPRKKLFMGVPKARSLIGQKSTFYAGLMNCVRET